MKHKFLSLIITYFLLSSLMMVSCMSNNSKQESGSNVRNPNVMDTVLSGYCAVGSVDETSKSAKILIENGDILSVNYEGNHPKEGMVQLYEKNGDSWVFNSDDTNFPPYGEQYNNRKISIGIRQRSLNVGSKIYVDSNTIFFVRYSKTEWRVIQGRSAISQYNSGQPGYLLGVIDTVGYIWFSSEFAQSAKLAHAVMIVGSCAEEGEWLPANAETTKFMDDARIGFSSGDKDLS